MDTPEKKQTLEFSFTETSGEYFRIWLVNTLLTILTLGIYSAWAKVRTRQYLLRNTYLAGSSFDYHANPLKILKGRIILFALGTVYFVLSNLVLAHAPDAKPNPAIVFPFFLTILVLFSIIFPWLILKGVGFNLRNTSYRNIRFAFQSTYRESFQNYLAAILLSSMTFGVGLFYGFWRHYAYLVNNARYGNHSFTFRGRPAEFFMMTFKIFLILILMIISIAGMSVVVYKLFGTPEGTAQDTVSDPIFITAIYTGIGLIYAFSISLILAIKKANTVNLVLNNMSLGNIMIVSKLKTFKLMFIYLTNALIMILTLGFALPWALIRSRNYCLENISLTVSSSDELNTYLGRIQEENADGNFADATFDFFDFDLGF